MLCPHDGSQLVTETYEADIQVDRCPTCKGLWLEKGELETIEAHGTPESEQPAAFLANPVEAAFEMARQRTDPIDACPKCGEGMERREYGFSSRILMDVCVHGDGIWLDNGELEAIEAFFERNRKDASNEETRGLFATLIGLFRR